MEAPEIILIIEASMIGLIAILVIFLVSSFYACRIAKKDRLTRKHLLEQERIEDNKLWEEIDYKS